MEKLLVIGAESVVGSNLALAWSEQFEVCGCSSQPGLRIEGLQTVAAQSQDWGNLIHAERPRHLVYCGPLSQSSWDLDDGSWSTCGEDRRAQTLVDACRTADCRLIVISTDAQFSAPGMFHHEDSTCLATDLTTVAAREMEKILEAAGALVVRTHAYGWSPAAAARTSYVDRIWQSLDENAACAVYTQRYATPILTSDLAELLAVALRHNLTGVYHIAGSERTNAHRFATTLASIRGLPGGALRLRTDGENDNFARHQETSLDCRRIRAAINLPLPLLHEGLKRYVAQADEYCSRLGSHRVLCAAA